MHKTPHRLLLAVLSLSIIPSSPLRAQTAPAGDADSSRARAPALSSDPTIPGDETILLDPFTVATEHEGYQAVDTLGGGRVRTKLMDTPSALSVVTKKFMQDLGITNAQDLLIYTNNTEVAGLNGNFSGLSTRGFGVTGAAEGSRLVNPAGVNRSRGLTAMDSTRNYFLSEIPWDGFNISRVDISRGPNSFLFGVGSPSGISNVSTNDAHFKDLGSIEGHVGSFGSTRESLDYNKVLLPSELAARLDLVNDDTQFKQKPAFNHAKRAYAALRYDPKFLSTAASHTKLQANFETGLVDSNNPRVLPPIDYITPYFDSSVKKTGYNPFTYQRSSTGGLYDQNGGSPWVDNSDIHYAWGTAPTYWFDGSTGAGLTARQGIGGTIGNTTTTIGGFTAGVTPNLYRIYTAGFSHYAKAVDANWKTTQGKSPFPGAYAGSVNYNDKTLSDSSIFDFYNKLIDGPNKHEWQRWNTFNVSLVESLFSDRLVIQAVAEHEEYRRGQEGPITGYWPPYISVELDSQAFTVPSWLPGAATNPNVGRPFIGGDFGGGDSASYFTHNNYQLTAAYSLNAEDIVGKSALSHILGTHEFTALGGRYTTKQEDRSWQMYAVDPATSNQFKNGLTIGGRNVNWVAYLGNSLANRSSAAGANLSNIAAVIKPVSGGVISFDNTWTAASSVNPTAPWVDPVPGGSVTLTQADNPDNYRGYRSMPATILNSQSNINDLYTDGNQREQRLLSAALMYQGHFWDNTIIPSFGWRSDKVRQRGNQAPRDSQSNVALMGYSLSDPGVEVNTTSTSYGIAIHLPKALKAKMPEGTDVSVYYFHGSNQTPRVRYGLDGTQLPNEQGKTDDYSIQFDGLNGRATLRFTAFKTVDKYAAASYGQPLGSVGWLIDSLPAWTLTMGASGVAASQLPDSALPTTDGFVYQSWLWGWGRNNPALAQQVGQALRTDFVKMFPQSYWNQYGMNYIDVAAIQRGDWLHILNNGLTPLPWNIPNSHLIHGVFPTIDQDLVSKGFEMEATIRPVKNWDLTFNASRVRAYQTQLGAGAANYLNGMARLWLSTPLGEVAEWGGAPIKNEFLNNLWGPYLTQVALTGSDQPELRKWHFNVVSNYTFDRGTIKGLNLGVAYRWDAKNIVGYGIKQADVYGNPGWITDVNKPFYGPSEAHVDAWIGYQHKLTAKLDWRIQLNVRNVGEQPGLVPITYEPDGSVGQQRIKSGQTFDLSTKIMF